MTNLYTKAKNAPLFDNVYKTINHHNFTIRATYTKDVEHIVNKNLAP